MERASERRGIEVNDTIKLLKEDRSRDVRAYVEDIQTFPLNDDRDVNVEELKERLYKIKSE